MKCKATNKDDATVDEQFGKVGKQVIENTGPLTRKRMETVDEEFLGAAMDFMDRKTKEGGPWFCYFNPTRMHVFTHLKESSRGKTDLGLYPDGMVELDGYVGQLLQEARRPWRRRQHHRRLHYRQRCGSAVLAGRRLNPVPRREGHQLGRRMAHPLRHALAWRHRAWPCHQRHLLAPGLHPHLRCRERRARARREGQEGLQDRRQDLQGAPRRLQPAAIPVGQGGKIAPARDSFTGATTAT